MMIRVAAYQANAKPTFSKRKGHILEILAQADEQKIDFLCLPEGFLTGYYAEKELAEESALEVAGRDFQEWLKEISSFCVTVVVGFNEKEGNKIYDSAAIVEGGQLLGIQRKHYLYHNYFSSSNHFSVFTSKGITFGVVICLDTNYFEPARILALQKAAILFTPMCNKVAPDHPFVHRPPHYSQFVARTHENRCWLVGADWIWPNDGKLTCPGHSVIYDPDGREMARSLEGVEQFIVAEIPQGRLFHEKGQRVHGSPLLVPVDNRRPEHIKLSDDALIRRAHLPDKPSPIVLKGQYVHLEPLVIARDSQPLFEFSNGNPIKLKEKYIGAYDSDTLIWRYMFDGPFASSSDFAAHLPKYVNASHGLCFCAFDALSRQQVGIANFINNAPIHLKIELGGIWYSPIVQRTWVNTEATYLMCRHAFDLGYRRVEWKCDALNTRSRQAALRMGFKFEGIQENHMIVKGSSRDTAWFRILDHEWPVIKKRLEAQLY